MKYKLAVCLLAGLVTLTGCNDGPQVPSPSELEKGGFASPEIPRITAEQLKLMYENREPYILVDTRANALFLTGYIPGARNIPNEPWEESFSSLAKLPKDRLIITYCDCGDDGEAAIAAARLRLSEYDNVKILWKGIDYWQTIGGEIRQ